MELMAMNVVTYIPFSIPRTLLAKAVLPSTSVACGALIWSIATTCQAAATTPGAFYVCRLFIGVGESMFGQAMALYFTFWYRKNEIAKRIGLFISAGSLAGALSGLIAYGIARISNPSIKDFKVLFLVEGAPSVLLAIVVFFFLPSRPDKSKYLKEDERVIACTRLNADSLLSPLRRFASSSSSLHFTSASSLALLSLDVSPLPQRPRTNSTPSRHRSHLAATSAELPPSSFAEMDISTNLITFDWTAKGSKKFFDAGAEKTEHIYSPVVASRWKLSLQLTPEHKEHVGVFLEAVKQPNEALIDGVFERMQKTLYSFQIFDIGDSALSEVKTVEHSKWTLGYGKPECVSRDAAFFGCPAVQAADALVVRCTISHPPYSSTSVTSTEFDFLRSCSSVVEELFDVEESSDVCFVIQSSYNSVPRRLFGHSSVLKKRSSYFRTMFASDLSEGALSTTTRPLAPTSSSKTPWDDDDDSLEWLPSTWLAEHGSKTMSGTSLSTLESINDSDSAVSSDGVVANDGNEEQLIEPAKKRSVVKVTDAGYTTYRSMLYFLYSNQITFTPPASNFVIELVKKHSDSAVDLLTDEEGISGVSRRDFLLKGCKKSEKAGEVEPASPHAVYKLADKLDLDELKALAKKAIVEGFTVENILYELISTFAYQHDEIQSAALDFALKDWDFVKSTPSFSRVVDGSCLNEIDGANEIWKRLLGCLKADVEA